MKKFTRIIYLIAALITLTQFAGSAAGAGKKDIAEEDKNNFTKVASFDEIKPALMELLDKRNPAKTLIIMPLEKVMITPKPEGFKKQDNNYKSLAKKAFLKIRTSQRIYLNEVMLVEYENELTDPSLPDFIKSIQKAKAPFIVMTSNLSGSYNDIPYLEVWTLKFLEKHNIDFSENAFSRKSLVLQELTEVKGTYPTFYKGLLSCNSEKEDNACHQVLSTLLAGIKFLPDTVVIIHSDAGILDVITKQFKSLRSDTEVIGFIYEPPAGAPSTLSPTEYLAFMSNFAEKVNNVKRTTVKNTEVDDPYEE